MGRLRAAHIARLRQLSPHPLTFVSFSPFPPSSGASHSAPSPHRGGGGQPRPSCQAPRGVGQALLVPRPGASPSPTSSVTLGGWCLHEGWGTGKDAGGHRGLPQRSSALRCLRICRSNSLLQREGLCLTLCGWRKVAEEPKAFLPASEMLFP